ncbi:MAG: hypothetical protein HC904_06290 [Blastochloris sp.]|nr:hypothetical protein [Blastochloris sp.]
MFKGFRYLASMVAFGWPFLRTYWFRFSLGLALGILYAAINGLSVGVTPLIVQRLEGGVAQEVVSEQRAEFVTSSAAEGSFRRGVDEWTAPVRELAFRVGGRLEEGGRAAKEWLDPWLPLRGRPIESQQIFGAIFLITFFDHHARGLGLSEHLFHELGQ